MMLPWSSSSSNTSVAPPLPAAAPPPPAPPPPPPPPPPLSVCRADLPHHRLYEFAKAALIKIFVSPYATVCDLYCGNGADADKWDDAQIGHYIGIDVTSSGVSEFRESWESQRKECTAEFFEFDPCSETLELQLKDKELSADVVCCLQHLQLCFESEERVKSLLHNVSSLLRPGGYFFGIIPDSSTIWTKYQKNVEASHNRAGGMKPSTVPNCIRSENYVITFETEEEKFPLFGKRYQLKFTNDVTSEIHFLVHFPSLIRWARESGLEYVEIQNLTEFYDDNRAQFAGMLSRFGANFVDPRGRLLPRSFDVLGLYSTFIFQKPDPDMVPPVMSPMLQDGSNVHEEQNWMPQMSVDEDNMGHTEASVGLNNKGSDHNKGILGPGPADLRFAEHF
ncbi:mRNA cap guanine-N7 methyltransferase 2 [Acorus gramineus]|uniref:mRNA cap guanine-N(7) methyltransferase 2 n=1 Tax=Acorus gramineus TaxID=55184 RepID=A0AAV9AG90_ACOGR|nr:mRNA cap guanine-N7 methyltransferase 2 [Acorus gramineus]